VIGAVLLSSALVGAYVIGASDKGPVEGGFSAVAGVRAFPGAEGFGTDTVGGRGGQVLLVTNLNDSGAGSLRAALTATGPRTVVFRVSGTILLKSRIDVVSPYLTVAGQTAPGGGITLRMDPAASPCSDKGTMLVSTHDVVIRYLRLRPGPTDCADDSHDGLTIYEPGTYNVVIDHVSMSWAVDEVLNTYDGAQKVTISNSIIAEGLSNSTHPQGEHSKGSLLGGVDAHDISLHHNLFVANKDRNPQVSGLSVADVRNNVVYNYGDGSGSGVTLVSSSKGEPRVNWVGNYYKPGPASDPSRPEFGVYDGSTGETWRWYGDGNMRWTSGGLQGARVDSGATGSRVQIPFAVAPVTTTPAATAYTQVLDRAGASVPHRDAVDVRLVKGVMDGTGRLIDDPSQVGGYPTLPATAPLADGDGDGMPNSAEVARETNPTVPDASGDIDGNGYTNIEDWFNGLVGSSGGAVANASPTATSSPTTSPTPTASPTTSPTPTASPTTGRSRRKCSPIRRKCTWRVVSPG
jgi:pectate lyase